MSSDDPDLWTELGSIVAQLNGLERNVMRMLVTSRDKELRAACVRAGSAGSAAWADAAVAWAVAAAVDIAHRDWTSMFTGLSAAEGKRLAAESRGQVANDNRSLTYGEVNFFSFAVILEVANPPKGALFVDLGHGTGRAVLAAALLRGHMLDECRGVEVLPALVHASWAAQAKYDATLKAKPDLYGSSSSEDSSAENPAKKEGDSMSDEFSHCSLQPGQRAVVVQILGDLLSDAPKQGTLLVTKEGAPKTLSAFSAEDESNATEAGPDAGLAAAKGVQDVEAVAAPSSTGLAEQHSQRQRRDPQLWEDGAWTDGDLIFVNSTCFAHDVMASVGQKCAALKLGAVVVTLTQSLEFCPHLTLFDTRMLSMSWGPATAFFHRRSQESADVNRTEGEAPTLD